jgi:hypothetical protein
MALPDPVEHLCKNAARRLRRPDSERFVRGEKSGASRMFYTKPKRLKTRREKKACTEERVPVI